MTNAIKLVLLMLLCGREVTNQWSNVLYNISRDDSMQYQEKNASEEVPVFLNTSMIMKRLQESSNKLNCKSIMKNISDELSNSVDPWDILGDIFNSTTDEKIESEHHRMKRCTDIEMQNRILQDFFRKNQKLTMPTRQAIVKSANEHKVIQNKKDANFKEKKTNKFVKVSETPYRININQLAGDTEPRPTNSEENLYHNFERKINHEKDVGSKQNQHEKVSKKKVPDKGDKVTITRNKNMKQNNSVTIINGSDGHKISADQDTHDTLLENNKNFLNDQIKIWSDQSQHENLMQHLPSFYDKDTFSPKNNGKSQKIVIESENDVPDHINHPILNSTEYKQIIEDINYPFLGTIHANFDDKDYIDTKSTITQMSSSTGEGTQQNYDKSVGKQILLKDSLFSTFNHDQVTATEHLTSDDRNHMDQRITLLNGKENFRAGSIQQFTEKPLRKQIINKDGSSRTFIRDHHIGGLGHALETRNHMNYQPTVTNENTNIKTTNNEQLPEKPQRMLIMHKNGTPRMLIQDYLSTEHAHSDSLNIMKTVSNETSSINIDTEQLPITYKDGFPSTFIYDQLIGGNMHATDNRNHVDHQKILNDRTNIRTETNEPEKLQSKLVKKDGSPSTLIYNQYTGGTDHVNFDNQNHMNHRAIVFDERTNFTTDTDQQLTEKPYGKSTLHKDDSKSISSNHDHTDGKEHEIFLNESKNITIQTNQHLLEKPLRKKIVYKDGSPSTFKQLKNILEGGKQREQIAHAEGDGYKSEILEPQVVNSNNSVDMNKGLTKIVNSHNCSQYDYRIESNVNDPSINQRNDNSQNQTKSLPAQLKDEIHDSTVHSTGISEIELNASDTSLSPNSNRPHKLIPSYSIIKKHDATHDLKVTIPITYDDYFSDNDTEYSSNERQLKSIIDSRPRKKPRGENRSASGNKDYVRTKHYNLKNIFKNEKGKNRPSTSKDESNGLKDQQISNVSITKAIARDGNSLGRNDESGEKFGNASSIPGRRIEDSKTADESEGNSSYNLKFNSSIDLDFHNTNSGCKNASSKCKGPKSYDDIGTTRSSNSSISDMLIFGEHSKGEPSLNFDRGHMYLGRNKMELSILKPTQQNKIHNSGSTVFRMPENDYGTSYKQRTDGSVATENFHKNQTAEDFKYLKKGEAGFFTNSKLNTLGHSVNSNSLSGKRNISQSYGDIIVAPSSSTNHNNSTLLYGENSFGEETINLNTYSQKKSQKTNKNPNSVHLQRNINAIEHNPTQNKQNKINNHTSSVVFRTCENGSSTSHKQRTEVPVHSFFGVENMKKMLSFIKYDDRGDSRTDDNLRGQDYTVTKGSNTGQENAKILPSIHHHERKQDETAKKINRPFVAMNPNDNWKFVDLVTASENNSNTMRNEYESTKSTTGHSAKPNLKIVPKDDEPKIKCHNSGTCDQMMLNLKDKWTNNSYDSYLTKLNSFNERNKNLTNADPLLSRTDFDSRTDAFDSYNIKCYIDGSCNRSVEESHARTVAKPFATEYRNRPNTKHIHDHSKKNSTSIPSTFVKSRLSSNISKNYKDSITDIQNTIRHGIYKTNPSHVTDSVKFSVSGNDDSSSSEDDYNLSQSIDDSIKKPGLKFAIGDTSDYSNKRTSIDSIVSSSSFEEKVKEPSDSNFFRGGGSNTTLPLEKILQLIASGKNNEDTRDDLQDRSRQWTDRDYYELRNISWKNNPTVPNLYVINLTMPCEGASCTGKRSCNNYFVLPENKTDVLENFLKLTENPHSPSDLLKLNLDRRGIESPDLCLMELKSSKKHSNSKSYILSVMEVDSYLNLLELLRTFLMRDPHKLLSNEAKSPDEYVFHDPDRKFLNNQFFFVNPEIIEEFLEIYKKYKREETSFERPGSTSDIVSASLDDPYLKPTDELTNVWRTLIYPRNYLPFTTNRQHNIYVENPQHYYNY